MEIATERLVLRPLADRDRDANAAIFADPEVRRFALGTLDRDAADARLDRCMAEYERTGFGMLAVQDRLDGSHLGMIGLTGFGPALAAAIPSHPGLQIAWQLARHAWGRGLATEGARAVLEHAASMLGQTNIVAITAAINGPSRRVMDKLGMQYRPDDDFLHPDIPVGHGLAPHVLYRTAHKPPT
jgi:RimJ/RimL family protein N-acetyltransferase